MLGKFSLRVIKPQFYPLKGRGRPLSHKGYFKNSCTIKVRLMFYSKEPLRDLFWSFQP